MTNMPLDLFDRTEWRKLLEAEGDNFGIKKAYMSHLSLTDLSHIYYGQNNISLANSPEIVIAQPVAALTIPYAISLVKRNQKKHEELSRISDIYELFMQLNEIAVANKNMDSFCWTYSNKHPKIQSLPLTRQTRSADGLRELEKRLMEVPQDSWNNFIRSLREPRVYSTDERDIEGGIFAEPNAIREHKDWISVKTRQVYNAAEKKYIQRE